jgi:RimJ/RimL family protein N-acetyltransferase
LTRIYAMPFATSLASIRVLEKAGYVCEGRLRRSVIKLGQVLDQFMYADVR